MGKFTKRVCLVLFWVSLIVLSQAKRDPIKEYRECRERCQEREQGRREQQLCESVCEKVRKQHEGEWKEGKEEWKEWKGREGRESRDEVEGREEFEERNPYVFQTEHFESKFRTQEGRVRVLPKFTQRSKLFKGIENFRVVLFEANPQTFSVPMHWDADAIVFVAKGRGTLSLVFTDRRESFNIEQGHVLVVPAGVTAYLINSDNNEKLVLAELFNPVSNPGNFEPFFSSGGENPESIFNAFSTEVLEAAFKTSADKVQRIFSQQREGIIIRASKEQIRALTHDEGSGHWPFGGKSKRDLSPINLLRQDPKESNEFGKLFEIDPSDNKVLQDLQIAVAFANITQGAMHTPVYNSRATKISVVLNGRGEFEMACPHVSKSGRHQQQQQQQQRQQQKQQQEQQQEQQQYRHHDSGRSRRGEESETPVHYEKIHSELRPGTVFIVPPGHPYVTFASPNDNLEIVCFEINAENNQKFPLAGQKNILKNIEREAKELAFAISAEEVDEVFENQDEDFFFQGPRQQRRHRGGMSII
ncbi:vicilin Cor a 11.0101-like [Silene latifolia]|uniref:vicilin Cor a 11.0101-like n=1 Tax=Silene latifolia TaxID=37657 RepID=UPI003D77A22F